VTELLAAVREQHLEGIIGKRKDSPYQPGKRSGAWIKYRVNRGQELVIGGYTPGPYGIDAIIVGYQGDGGLTYVARIRNGFVPASRRQVFEKLRPLTRFECPFVNLRAQSWLKDLFQLRAKPRKRSAMGASHFLLSCRQLPNCCIECSAKAAYFVGSGCNRNVSRVIKVRPTRSGPSGPYSCRTTVKREVLI
jgi:ATP dependent DNA ligase domain